MDDSDGFTRPLPTVTAEIHRVDHERRTATTAAERREADARSALNDATRYRGTAAMATTQLDALLLEMHRATLDTQAAQLAADIDSISTTGGMPA